MMKNISILGSTGSIGIQALQVIRSLKDEFKIVGLAAKSNVDIIEKQIEEFKPKIVALEDELSAEILKTKLKGKGVEIVGGIEGIIQVATEPSADTVLSAIVGIAGLIPTLKAIRSGKNIALSNKESLVTAGHIIMKEAYDNGVTILPVDGEHSAIMQCLDGCKNRNNIRRLILTASGGPFRNKTYNELINVTPEQALNHPNWRMGKKITIDSATLMNKGFEVIEARWLFDIDISKIDIIIHTESIVHSMVEFNDGSIIAQLGATDMRLPIQLALTYPKRINSSLPRLDLTKVKQLNFQDVDMEKFPCLKYAYEAGKVGGTLPVVVNGADEIAVEAFLNHRIGFLEISEIIRETMDAHKKNNIIKDPSLNDILSKDLWSREFAKQLIDSKHSKDIRK
ncbi:MAG: 1-deoxy-D-xylulose-5-phosphate reductoisomerase [bacterium]